MLSHYKLCPVSSAQRQQWDTFVSNAPSGHLLQSWGWGELKAHAGWSPLRLALWHEDDIVAAATILRRTAAPSSFTPRPPCLYPKGPVIDWSDSILCDAFFSQLTPYLRKQGAIALRMEPGEETLCR